MVTKKDLIIAVLVTFCLTAMIFMVMPIKSANNAYDPMLDYFHTGTIGLPDLVKLAQSYGTTGDPTMPVNVTSMPYESVEYLPEISPSISAGSALLGYAFTTQPVFVGGYSRMSVFVAVYRFNDTPSADVQFGIRDLMWTNGEITADTSPYPVSGAWWPYFNCTLGNQIYAGTMTFETSGPYVDIYLGALSPTQNLTFTVTITVYLRNE